MSLSSTRREFLRETSATIGAAAILAGLPNAVTAVPASAALSPKRRRYAVVGTGMRGGYHLWGRLLQRNYGDCVEFVGLCDTNSIRVQRARGWIGVDCPTFTDFDQMCAETKPDLLMVTTPDAFHAGYIVRALDRGIDVMTEKPMVTDEKQCAAVLAAEKRNGRQIVVTFNYRYAPKHQQIKELLLTGELGEILSVDFNWYLDSDHGTSYFRRWHRLREMSGTLFVHKSTHHFDLMNWWLDSDPVDVVAHASLRTYGARNSPFRHTHCRPCPHQDRCFYFYDMANNREMLEVYGTGEKEDGYHRDGCVFRTDIDSFDTMGAIVRYANGVQLNYSLNAHMAYEGYRLAFNGTRGRLDVSSLSTGVWGDDERTQLVVTQTPKSRDKRKVGSGTRRIPVKTAAGPHGGGDTIMCDAIFRGLELPAHLRLPSSRAGAMSCLTGIAARRSVDENRRVTIAELLPG